MLKEPAQYFISCVCGEGGVEGSADGRTANEKTVRYWQDTVMSLQLLAAATCGGGVVSLCGFMLVCRGVAAYMPNLQQYAEGPADVDDVL